MQYALPDFGAGAVHWVRALGDRHGVLRAGVQVVIHLDLSFEEVVVRGVGDFRHVGNTRDIWLHSDEI